ncbi:MAG: tripartite tricarboxylate transporter substrate binding protein [Betaproteobacteria bacterium]|nr:MAG: tripartite tricarboxylate transporter substrate binding protein [Betaproteobacteria bacterium]
MKTRWAWRLGCLLAISTWTLDASAAQAPAYPSKPLRLLVPFTPGGSQDVAARLVSAPVAQTLGQNIVIDNRPGSGGLIAAQEAARAPADGYTLFMSSGAQMGISPALRPKIGYDPVKSFAHVIHLTDTPMVLIAHPQLPASNAKELVAYSLANRVKVNTASTGLGTYTHMTLELFKLTTGADLTHIPYKGAAPAITDLLGRQVQTMFTSTASAQPYTSTGRLKPIGIAAAKRSRAMPEAATFAEQGIAGLEVSSWVGISVPAGVQPGIVDRLAREFAASLQTTDVRNRLNALGAEVAGVSGPAFATMVRDDVARWLKVVRSAGIKLE